MWCYLAPPMSKAQTGGKRDSTLVTVVSALALAFSLVAIAGAFIPFLGGVAVFVSTPAVLLASAAMSWAMLRDSKLLLPTLALLIAALPAARYNYKEWRILWVESDQVCHPPSLGSLSLMGLIADLATSMDYRNAVGNQVCHQLGRTYADASCDGPVGRIKCE